MSGEFEVLGPSILLRLAGSSVGKESTQDYQQAHAVALVSKVVVRLLRCSKGCSPAKRQKGVRRKKEARARTTKKERGFWPQPFHNQNEAPLLTPFLCMCGVRGLCGVCLCVRRRSASKAHCSHRQQVR